ncbi:MAG: multicopper oxidase domain-containing protein [Pseudomonadota bacterium]
MTKKNTPLQERAVSRRSVLSFIKELSVGTAIVGTSGMAASLVVSHTSNAQSSAEASLIGEDLSGHGALLNVQPVNGSPTYNGKVPGPTLVGTPGKNIDVTLVNNLPALNDDCTENVNQFHGLNTTNLHTHGLHVSPSTDSSGKFDADNVFVSVVPKDQIVLCESICGVPVSSSFRSHHTKYRFELPAHHPSGTFWYHAHKHGSTQRQVGAGLSGPLIIPDPIGFMPDYIAEVEEKILMIMNNGLVLADPEGGGTFSPTLTLRPGEVQRWRIINAQAVGNSFAYLRTNVPELEVYQIAFDGLTLPRRIEIDQFSSDEPWLNPAALAPGNRTDLLVRVPENAKSGSLALTVRRGLSDLFELAGTTNAVELKINIEGEPIQSAWSDDDMLPGPGLREFGDTPLQKREVDFTPRFTVDRQPYDGQVNHTLQLGNEEQWTVLNSTTAVHAFHIHVNPFFVTHINGEALPDGSPLRRWQDTIGLPLQEGGQPGSVTFKTRFETYAGKFVLHCHILRHEDLGMMQTVEIVA